LVEQVLQKGLMSEYSKVPPTNAADVWKNFLLLFTFLSVPMVRVDYGIQCSFVLHSAL